MIGLSSIDQNDIEKDKGIVNDKEAMESAAMTFFTEDMNIPISTLNKMKITRVFKPATLEDTERLYVEFENEMSVKIVNRYRKNLAVGLRIFPWFPPALFPRFKALDDESYQLRKVREPFHQTDIRYETDDIALFKRLDKSHRWEKVVVKNLPGICLDPDLLARPTSTPPRGRNRASSKRKRSGSGSPKQASKTPKLPIPEIIDETKADLEEDENVEEKINDAVVEDNPSSNGDIGHFTEHHSYSPARPAPTKHSMITTTPGILSKLKQPKLNYKPIQVAGKKDFQ